MAVKAAITHKYHPNPRLSANQVAEYLEANSTGRRRILQTAKFPPTFLLVPYTDAKAALIGHLVRGGAESTLDSRLQTLRRKADNLELGDFDRRNSSLCIEAIESFQGAEARMSLGKLKFSRPGFNASKLKISGVSVSVSIDLLTERPSNKGIAPKGAAMLVFSKTKAAQRTLPERCKAVSLLIYEMLKEQAKSDEVYDPTMCMAVDIFNGTIYRAKGEQKQLLRTVGTSCDEVRNLWPNVQPPKDYRGPSITFYA